MTQSIDFRGSKINFSDSKKGKTIVLLHGYLENLTIWNNLSEKLSKQFRVIAIDLPGHGKTPCIGYIHSMEFMAQCIKRVIDLLHIKKIILVGHSMGGYVALAFAELFPERLSGLCLFHSTAMPDSEERKRERDRIVDIVRTDPKPYISISIPKHFAQENLSRLPKKVEEAKRIALNTPRQGIVAALKGMKIRKSRELVLKHITCPVLFIIGKKDVLLAWENLLLLAGLPKESYTEILEDTGHMGFYEAPEETYKAIKKFAQISFR